MGPRKSVEKVTLFLISLKIVIADEHYYNKTLEQRRDVLNAPSIDYLCKTIIFENTNFN
jgi:hypothetical protein